MNQGGKDPLESDMNLKFPVITISLSYDDIHEPIHVDLGSVPPFVATAIFEQVLFTMRNLSPGPKVTFGGEILIDASSFEDDLQFYLQDDDDIDDDN
jgi:hypothetical protein